MASLSVAKVATQNSTTDLILSTGNTNAGKIILSSANNNIYFQGSVNIAGDVQTTGFSFTGSNNVFDAYESGTFTPYTADTTTGGNTVTTHGTSYGNYIRIGDLVFLYITIETINTTSQVTTNDFHVSNLPFISFDHSGARYWIGSVNGTFRSNNQVQPLMVDTSTTYLKLHERSHAGAVDYVAIGEVTGNNMYITITYRSV